MIGISCMSGCPVGCKFCATGQMKDKWRSLTAVEMVEQVDFIRSLHPEIDVNKCKEFKVNMTRMGEPALNWNNVREAVKILQDNLCGCVNQSNHNHRTLPILTCHQAMAISYPRKELVFYIQPYRKFPNHR